MTSEISTKTIGIILEALALPILIIVAVLLNLPDKDLGAITVLLAFGICSLHGYPASLCCFSISPRNEK